MAWDLSVDLIKATVQLEQPLGNGKRTVGTGFLIEAPTPDGRSRTVLVTAAHVLDRMPALEARIGYRVQGSDGAWRYDPQPLSIRDDDRDPKWTRHPTRDIAAIVIKAPDEFARAAIPLSWLAEDETFTRYGLGPGDEMMALGFPRGLSANQAGFPILRSGRVASYPLAPSSAFPTFLLDFRVFAGAAETQEVQFVAGILTQQVELSGERLEIGIVTHARFVRETVALIDGIAPPPARPAEPPLAGSTAASVGVHAEP